MNWFTQKLNRSSPTPASPQVQPLRHHTTVHTQADLKRATVLDARAQDIHQTRIKIEQAQIKMAQCERVPVHHTPPLRATPLTKTSRFLNAVKTSSKLTLSKLKRNPAQVVPLPIKAETHLRQTTDKAKVESAKVAQIRQTSQQLQQTKEEVIRGNPGLAAYFNAQANQAPLNELLEQKSTSTQALENAKQALQNAGTAHTHASQQQSICKQNIQRLYTEILCEQNRYNALTQQQLALPNPPTQQTCKSSTDNTPWPAKNSTT